MHNIENYNLLVASINVFKRERFKLAQRYGLEDNLFLRDHQEALAKLDLEALLSVDIEEHPQEAIDNLALIRQALAQETKVQPQDFEQKVLGYKTELRKLIKHRRQKVAHYSKVSNLDFYVNKFFENLIQHDTILAELRRTFVVDYLSLHPLVTRKHIQNFVEYKQDHQGQSFFEALKDIKSKAGSIGINAKQMDLILEQASHLPLMLEHGPNLGRMLELQALAKSDRHYKSQLQRKVAVDKELNIDFNPQIGGRDYYLLDTDLPSLFYAYPNSAYLDPAEVSDYTHTSKSIAEHRKDNTIELTVHNIDKVYNQRKQDHETMFTSGNSISELATPQGCAELIRAYLGLLNTQEFVELRAIFSDLYPEINFPFSALYQAIYGQLNAYFALTSSASNKASVRSKICLDNDDEVLATMEKAIAHAPSFQQRYKIILQILQNLCPEEVKQQELKLLQLSSNLETKQEAVDLSPLALRYAQFLYGSAYHDKTGYIGLYFSEKGEFETQNLIKLLISQGYKVALPVMRPQGLMVFAPVRSLDFTDPQYYQRNKYGILEPVISGNTPIVHHTDLLVVATPVVAFDHQLNRMGMGGGYYDILHAYFTKIHVNVFPESILSVDSPISPEFIGLAHAWQEVPYCFPHKHDLVLNNLVLSNLEPVTAGTSTQKLYRDFGSYDLEVYQDLAQQYHAYRQAQKAKEQIAQALGDLSPAYADNFVQQQALASSEFKERLQVYRTSVEANPYLRSSERKSTLAKQGTKKASAYSKARNKAYQQAQKNLQACLKTLSK
ncbi:5-formyltetrahydrofolate cyclo-ligase [Psittacicella gerlachiana]|uniref:5-formyltetrahydrofolate cyclo-ligase n=1 Tax=Psittacicella gerlachiana TaxID=2028574 RepID=A0A3A1YKC0_9GAMM|nr:5-formyltetrahydrofolate cyclo-ligase [Psittacicella gerlachiana]RIY37916.1 hypothetical protein CKF59_01130 [Psittacicella gerlachiana]